MATHKDLSRFSRSIWLVLGVFFLFAIAFVVYVRSEKQIDRANELRFQSYLLADELRQSSDDLTRMVRTYVVTGDPIYKQRYQEILDIRDGRKPRPAQYNNIYWDLVRADNQRPRPAGQAIPLLELMRQAGFTQEEFARLAQAKANSDALSSTEFAAMALVESTDPTTEANRHSAYRMLHDAAYHQAKYDIMRPIDEFFQMMGRRTLAAVKTAEIHAALVRLVFVLFGAMLPFFLWRVYRNLQAILGGSMEVLHEHIARLGSGDFASAIPVAEGRQDSVLGWLSATQSQLAHLDAVRLAAEAKNQRLTQLYEALSQCNQAIVRCRSEQELFPLICRDVVNFGGMKMAWIGLLDPQTQWLRPVSSWGSGTEYLEGIQITPDASVPAGQGPTGTAMREDHPCWCQDYQHDPATVPWHERAASYGWKASAALPLHRDGVVIGAFTLYSGEVDAFDEAARNLLVEMAMDIDYALNSFAREAERLVLEERLRGSEESARLILENSLDAVINMDTNGRVMEWSGAAEQMFGYRRDEVIGNLLAELIIPPIQREAHNQGFQRLLATNEPRMIGRRIETSAMRRDGSELPVELSIAEIHRSGMVFFSAFIRDISKRKHAEEHIQRLAHFDALTGLANRILLKDRVEHALGTARRNQSPLAVLFFDLDHFKNVNDTLGHAIGDELLMEVASRMKALIRDEDTVARLGGDEFIMVLPGADANAAAHVAQKVMDSVSQRYIIQQNELVITPSIGIAMYPSDGDSFDTLSKCADVAMYRAKQDGRNLFRFFTPEMQTRSARVLQLENALRWALERGQLQLHYQPQVSLQDGHLVGAEALLRWTHPELGMVSPAEFIPIAEASGQIVAIGEWVLRSAVNQLKTWMRNGLPLMTVAVNLSAIQFRHPNLPDMVSKILEEAGLDPKYLELELTEGVAMDDPLSAIAIMDNLHARGVRMSIDDFGTGYSSLSYLKRFKVYKLKIDQSFVRDITIDSEDKAIVSAIISMASSLGMQTIAEGVETAGQLAFLRNQGCDEVQGYYYSKPLPVDAFEAYARSGI